MRTGFSLYRIATKKITKYMYLWLDIVDNYFLCTMKHFPRVSTYAVLAELLYILEFKKKYRKICVLVAAYIDSHPAEEISIIYVSKFGYCR